MDLTKALFGVAFPCFCVCKTQKAKDGTPNGLTSSNSKSKKTVVQTAKTSPDWLHDLLAPAVHQVPASTAVARGARPPIPLPEELTFNHRRSSDSAGVTASQEPDTVAPCPHPPPSLPQCASSHCRVPIFLPPFSDAHPVVAAMSPSSSLPSSIARALHPEATHELPIQPPWPKLSIRLLPLELPIQASPTVRKQERKKSISIGSMASANAWCRRISGTQKKKYAKQGLLFLVMVLEKGVFWISGLDFSRMRFCNKQQKRQHCQTGPKYVTAYNDKMS
jgi:hypothetical protein